MAYLSTDPERLIVPNDRRTHLGRLTMAYNFRLMCTSEWHGQADVTQSHEPLSCFECIAMEMNLG